QVEAPQQGGLARAGRADQADDLVLLDHEVDVPEHLDVAEGLAERLDDHGRAHSTTPAAWLRRRSRATSQSVKRVCGTVIATKSPAAATPDVKLNVAAWSICVCLNASIAPSTPTSAVSFCRPMKSFRSGGTTRRTACGMIT